MTHLYISGLSHNWFNRNESCCHRKQSATMYTIIFLLHISSYVSVKCWWKCYETCNIYQINKVTKWLNCYFRHMLTNPLCYIRFYIIKARQFNALYNHIVPPIHLDEIYKTVRGNQQDTLRKLWRNSMEPYQAQTNIQFQNSMKWAECSLIIWTKCPVQLDT